MANDDDGNSNASSEMPNGSQNITSNINNNNDYDGSQSVNPIYYPPLAAHQTTENNNINNDTYTHDDKNGPSDLHQACRLAVETERPLHLTASFLRLEETVVLRKQEALTIVGDYDSMTTTTTTTTSVNVTIQGDLHSLFVLNNFSKLTLRHIELKHTLEPRATSKNGCDHRQVGAAVNLRKKSSLDMQDGSLHSTCGFCLWIVQKSR